MWDQLGIAILWGLAAVAVLPVAVYLSVKLGVLAFYRGRDLFDKIKREENERGERTRRP